MKKIILAFLSLCITTCMWAQQNMVFDSKSQGGQKISHSLSDMETDSVMAIYWETADTMITSLGYGSANTITAFMEFYPEDILNFKGTGKKLAHISQISFYIAAAYRINIIDCKVILMQGSDVSSATEVLNQNVDIGRLVNGWNAVNLTDEYTSHDSLKLYVGCQITFNAKAYPLGAAKGSNPKQGWYRMSTNTSYINAATSGNFAILIKALASLDDAPANEIVLNAIDIPQYKIVGDSILIKGTIKTVGTDTLKSFRVSYIADKKESDTFQIKDVKIAPNSTYTFSIPKYYVCQEAKKIDMSVTISHPNEIPDLSVNNTQTAITQIYSELIPRVVLHEIFTSSTCGPCRQGNDTLMSVLKKLDTAKWVCVKYQYNIPSPGDPYYTAECGAKGTFYGGISGVPTLNVNGKALVINPYNYTVGQFNTLAQVPAEIKLSGIANIENKTVSLHVDVDPVCSIINPNLRFFAAIVEKTTVKNVKTNEETLFHYVMKKFMTNINGDKIDSLQIGIPQTFDYSYTFNGEYRLPANANSPINHATEHSIENFNDLMVVYWIQDISTKTIYQAGKAEDPDPHGTSITLVKVNEIDFSVFPNPATSQFTIQSSVPFTKITLVNSLGQTIKNIRTNAIEYQIGTEGLSKGMYLLRVETKQGISTQKVQIQ